MSTSALKILWVHDEFDGPTNGLAEYNGNKVWFRKIAESDNFELLQLDTELIEKLEINHKAYCEITGRPLLHGDPLILKRKPQTVKMDFSKAIPEGEDGIDMRKRVLLTTVTHNHSYDPTEVDGPVIVTVKSEDFTNFSVPRRIQT